MGKFASATDDIKGKGFIDKDFILSQVSQEDIFSYVFGFQPVELEYVTSPFREDNNPGCWFEYTYEGKLKFKDFGSWTMVGGRKMRNIDCFDAIQVYFQLPNLYKVLDFINKNIIRQTGKSFSDRKVSKRKKIPRVLLPKAKSVKLLIRTRDYSNRDRLYWSKYEITKQNLISDKVFPANSYKILNSKKGDFTVTPQDSTYCFTRFEEGRKKIYRPYYKKKRRFVTTCTANDIGDLKALVPYGRQLVISKSYKDCRVLRNQGLNCVWFQNEGMRPDNELLIPLCQRFDKVVVFFDNDKQGISSSIDVSEVINSHLPGKSQSVHLPSRMEKLGITDPADLIHRQSRNNLLNFLTENRLK